MKENKEISHSYLTLQSTLALPIMNKKFESCFSKTIAFAKDRGRGHSANFLLIPIDGKWKRCWQLVSLCMQVIYLLMHQVLCSSPALPSKYNICVQKTLWVKKSLNWMWLPLDLIPDRKTRQLDYFFILHTLFKLLHFSILQHTKKPTQNLFTYV